MAKDLMIRSSTEEFITFKVQEKDKGIQVRYENETLWMTQKAIAELFDCSTDNISLHLKNIFKEKVYIYFIVILKFMYTYFLFMILLLLHNLDLF